MNLKRVIIGLGTAIVLLGLVSGLSWFIADRPSQTQLNAQPVPNTPPTERVVPH